MKHTHVIEATSAEEFKKHVKELYQAIYENASIAPDLLPPNAVTPTTTAHAVNAVNDALAAAQEEKPAKKSKKQKEESPAPSSQPVSAASPPAETPAEASADDIFGDEPKAPNHTPYTMEDCQKRLQTVVSKVGIVKAKELLAKHAISKLVELPKDKFTSFVSDCDELT